MSRFRSDNNLESGVYAILYAALVVVLLAMAAIVVDLSAVRADRRLDRSATDSAALAGADQLKVGTGPHSACVAAWNYLGAVLHVSVPAGVCSSYTDSMACPATLVADDATIPGTKLTVRIAWPVPYPGDGGFLTPDLAPGGVSQPFNGASPSPGPTPLPGPANTDGRTDGCDKIGVAIFQNQSFGLAGAFGSTGTNTQVHSVARYNPAGGPPRQSAALNVLEPHDCFALRVGGTQTSVLIGPTTKDGVVISPGVVAIESDGRGSSCDPQNTMVLNGNGSLCASSVVMANPPTPASCDGKGIIHSHALDAGGANAFNPNDTTPVKTLPAGIQPRPTQEGGAFGWSPVTTLYGCEVLSPCPLGPSGNNYISQLKAAFKGPGMPSGNYGGSKFPYSILPFGTGFTNVSAYFCGPKPTPLPAAPFPTGYYYVACDINIAGGESVIFQGGTLVVDGGLKIKSGCFVMNYTTCSPTLPYPGQGTAQVTTSPAPNQDATVYLRGGTFEDDDRLIMPETFIFQEAASSAFTIKTSSPITLWTAPGAGGVTGGQTTLESHCWVTTPAPAHVDEECLNSRFSRIAYWSEYKTPAGNAAKDQDSFQGQGSLNMVGVFFAPRAYLNLSGGGTYTAAAAQFWAKILDISGNVPFVLTPEDRAAVPPPSPTSALIR